MYRFLAALVVLGGVGMSAQSASAADGCGRGYDWNGWRCVPTYRTYAPRYYAPPPPAIYVPLPSYRRSNGCPPGYEWKPRYRKCTSNFN